MINFFIYFIFTLIINLNCETFQAHRAGNWYPKDKKELTDLLQKLTMQAKNEFGMQTNSPQIRALICPHAGYEYSGKVSAASYQLLDKNKIDKVIILGPSHYVRFNGIAIPKFEKYQTPLGIMNVDLPSVKKLKDKPLVTCNDAFFKPEHSIEMQLPFIQFTLPKAKIVPIIIGNITDENVNEIALLLKKIVTKKTLLIISTDFTHYGKSFNYIPFKDNILLNITQLDSAVLNTIQRQNLKLFQSMINKTKDTVCGYNPLRILLECIKLDTFANSSTRLVSYGTSFDKTNDENNVVSYASLVVTNDVDNNILNMQEQKSLLAYARQTLEQAFTKEVNKDLSEPIMTPLLERSQGAFVTLWSKDENGKKKLRGCIGQVNPTKSLYLTIAEKSLDAAFRDSRFTRLKQEDLKNIIIEISVLQKPKPIKSYKKIILNKHGIILQHGKNISLFLPKVPQEFGFNLTQTLEQLSLKAGLSKDGYKSAKTTFQVFEAQDFSEN
ncbi:MAG: AmmeMemoRadiSam system protein B [Candidatus Babeliales bacterium]|nr:AmmeMemoRadiSam system protein B [Candidatus Babeliales bacterium]